VLAIVIAWAFELTPEEIKRIEDVDSALDSRTKSHAWIYVAIIAALVSISLFLPGRFTASTKQNGATEVLAKSIAVLPFQNLSEAQLSDVIRLREQGVPRVWCICRPKPLGVAQSAD